jgi:hypothetical protein
VSAPTGLSAPLRIDTASSSALPSSLMSAGTGQFPTTVFTSALNQRRNELASMCKKQVSGIGRGAAMYDNCAHTLNSGPPFWNVLYNEFTNRFTPTTARHYQRCLRYQSFSLRVDQPRLYS